MEPDAVRLVFTRDVVPEGLMSPTFSGFAQRLASSNTEAGPQIKPRPRGYAKNACETCKPKTGFACFERSPRCDAASAA